MQCDRLSDMASIYNVPPITMLWSSPGLQPAANDIFYQPATGPLNLYIPRSVAVQWPHYITQIVEPRVSNSTTYNVDPALLHTFLPVLIPIDILVADAAALVVVTPDANATRRTVQLYYLMTAVASALQDNAVRAAIGQLRNFNATFNALIDDLERDQPALCANLTMANVTDGSVMADLRDCVCGDKTPYWVCLAEIIVPLTVRACATQRSQDCPM